MYYRSKIYPEEKKFNMFHIRYMMLVLFLTAGYTLQAKDNMQLPSDTTITFRVSGACSMCKDRIEKAAKMKGVHTAVWDEESHYLTLQYNPQKVTLEKIENSIIAAGHDLDDRKAADVVYNKLPDCCLYRTINANTVHDSTLVNDTKDNPEPGINSPEMDLIVKGVVLEEDFKGVFRPLEGASITWLGATAGTVTDSSGVFSIRQEGKNNRLIVSYSGYEPDTLTIKNVKELKIILGSGKHLHEVVVTSRLRSTYVSALNPIRTQVMTERELFKAACCNLSESFETNPSVDVSFNDAVTGSKQIQLLGLSGIYTQLTVENLPGPRGIATTLGLNSIPGPWVESIQLTKGIGSVANGYESIAGQINVEMKKHVTDEKLFANVYVNDYGKTDLNLNYMAAIGKKWSTAVLLHDDFLTNATIDFNKDGFRDLPTGNQFGLVNRWLYEDGKSFHTEFGIKVLREERTGGETKFKASEDKFTTNHYGLGISTSRYEGFAKIGYVFPEKKYKSFGLQLAGISHRQDSYFGLTRYDAKQQNFYGNLIYQSIINNTNHKFRTGFSFLYDKYDEWYKLDRFRRTEVVPGAFFEYTFTHTDKFTLVAGLRGDHNSLFGFFATPRIHVRYEPVKGTTIRVSAGRGQRTANIFAENNSVLVSSRKLNIINAAPGKAYGLDAEVAWNKGVSVDQKFRFLRREATLSLDFFRNDFNNQVVVDLENPGEVNFYNLDGRSFSNSFQAELNIDPVKKLELRLAYRYFYVKSTYGGKELQRPLIANSRAFANLAYAVKGWKFDYTINAVGKKRVPGTQTNPVQYQRETTSPEYILMNAQITKTVGKKYPMDFYIGSENLANYFQANVIVAADQPFGPYFDASLVWGPVSGRMVYVGWRYKLK
mgnify:FL=1